MDTITRFSEITDLLRQRRYHFDFNLKENSLGCGGNFLKILPGRRQTLSFRRLAGPRRWAIVYAISFPKYNLKGVRVNGQGISNDMVTNEMVKALDEKKDSV